MQVQQLPIYQFLEGSGKSFVIPVYQRDYAWTRINCQKLWDDLVDLRNNTRADHFLGTIVTVGSGFQEYTVIDGQQRLTTASILLIALHTFLKDKEEKDDEEKVLSEQILDFLINKYSSEKDKRIRLKPNKQDKEYFENLFENENPENASSNIVSNFNFFYEKIKSGAISPREVFESFRKLKIVLIDLVRGQDDPQLIFESLNSTGVDLTAGDLIRNYILMDLEPSEQEKMHKDYWIKIEKLTENVAEFVRNYLIFKTKTWVKKDDVYSVFKKFSLEEFNRDKESILEDLLYFAEIYGWLVQTIKHPNSAVNKQLERLNKLEFTVSHPYLLDVFNDFKENVVSEKTVEEILKIIESYAFRKILVDNTTQGLNKMFIILSKEIKKETAWKEDYLNILSYIVLEKRASQRFPNDEEFENSLVNKEVYRLQSKNRNFLLESLENYKSAYPINVDELTVEHIMPQTLTKEWKSRLGDNWQEVHKKYLHTLGNLSLTAKNTELSNNAFEDKQRIDFQTSRLKLNFKLEGITTWNEEKIIDRAKDLIKNSKDIWPYPKTSYTKPIPEEQIFDLTSEDNFSGSKPSHLYLEDDEKGIELKTWRDLLTNVCKFLYDFSPTQFQEIQKSEEFKWYFDINKPLRSPLEFSTSKFVEGGMSANSIVNFLGKISERINYPLENISFSIKETKE
ncbi:MAG TPA: DUF262 domain-containing HNH endonuclease family protein [Candidatus Saccharibacteria bacterium]|nr:DUF262 domain-containing HNH endonuclease family protein [Candidatus Saccharibacteria bacterium]